MIFYDSYECVMSVIGTMKHSQCNCIDTCHLAIKLYCIMSMDVNNA